MEDREPDESGARQGKGQGVERFLACQSSVIPVEGASVDAERFPLRTWD